MALYTSDSIERVRDAVDMVELVGGKTDLRRVGSRWLGLCPFHDERTPSFSVNNEKKVYYCFGCEAKGDAIGFVRETEALDFREAVDLLAERYGVELELQDEDPRAEQRRRRRERLHALLERTTRFYATYLWEAGEAARARSYMEGRGLGEEVLRDFRIGYAPSAWDRVVVGAQRDGFSPEEIAAAGLGQRGKGGGFYDRFRGRIMFPLSDARGRVLGFGARAVRDTQQPKYLNTSESEIYHKGRQLFGIHQARPHSAKSDRVVVAEGYTDVLALHQAGIREAVAIMGTALTQEQLAELDRTVGREGLVYLALDADRSGQEAMLRAARASGDDKAALRVIEMPVGSDPADLLAEKGVEAFKSLLETAVPVLEFQVRRVVADGELDTPAGIDQALKEALALIAVAQEPATREHLVRFVADRLNLPLEHVMAQLSTSAPAGAQRPATDPAPIRRSPGGLDPFAAERKFLVMCLGSGPTGREFLSRVTDEHLSSEVARRARDHIDRHFEDPLALLPEEDPPLAAFVTGVVMEAEEEQQASQPALEMSLLGLEYRRIERGIRHATEAGDRTRQRELATAKQDVRREMDAVMGQTA
jgi:DNA primase